MKKTLLMLTVAGMAMAGCSNSEVLDEAAAVQTGKINFETLVGKGTRVPMTNASLESFYVFGKYAINGKSTQIFNDVRVYKSERQPGDGRTTDWTYDGQSRYWIANASYKFSAYSNGNNQLSSGAGTGRSNYNIEAGELVIADYLVDDGHQEDLIYAAVERNGVQDRGNKAVAFTFKHLLSKLHVTFTSAFPEGFEIEVSNVRVNNIRNKGSYNAENNRGKWSGVNREESNLMIGLKFLKVEGETTTKVNAAKISAAKGDTPAVTATTGDIYVMPFKYELRNIDLIFDIIVYDPQGEEVFRETLKGQWQPEWLMNTSYNYNVTLNGTAAGMQKIEFTVVPETGVSDWATATGQTLEFERTTSGS